MVFTKFKHPNKNLLLGQQNSRWFVEFRFKLCQLGGESNDTKSN